MAWLNTLSDMKCYESAIVSTKIKTIHYLLIKNMCSHFILSSCVREDVVIMTKNENKLSGIKLKYDKPCKFDLFKHSGHQTSRLCSEWRFVLDLLSTVTYRKMFRYTYLFQSFARSFYSTFSHVNRGHVSRVLCIFL